MEFQPIVGIYETCNFVVKIITIAEYYLQLLVRV